ncbi:hypothetical protein Cgig2_009569 [Carnegiea gigantea]|uniref:Uncharacterized protein n=1 Tax=Carnegiea gigantea TaxID=171969 RepID=A0A9Q1KA69_9CARY|nr:hypothetical protein Cgig2_009569 [Carnegiea gigantea]
MSTPPHLSLSDDDEIDPFAALLLQDDAVHPNYSDVIPACIPAGDPNFRRHHVSSLNADIVIRQLPSEGLAFQLWPAATTLLSLLDDRHLEFRRQGRRIRILELGSGTGLVGIAAAAILGADVTVTDLAPVIGNLEFNVAANSEVIAGGGGGVSVAELSWGNVDQMEKVGREYDLILGSDVVYHNHLYEPLMETLRYFLVGGERKEEEGEGMVFVMAHLKRWKKETAFFKKANKFFEVVVIHRDPPSDGARVGVIVYRFAGKKRPPLGSGSRLSLGSGSGSGSGSRMGSSELKETGVERAHTITRNLDNGFPLAVELIFNLIPKVHGGPISNRMNPVTSGKGRMHANKEVILISTKIQIYLKESEVDVALRSSRILMKLRLIDSITVGKSQFRDMKLS